MDPNELRPVSDEAKCLNVPYDQRWECLRVTITKLYLECHGPDGPGGKTMTIPQVVEFMKMHYSFHAVDSQYRSHFRRWKVSKRTFTAEKNQVVQFLGKRMRPGLTTGDVTLQRGEASKEVDKKQLKRHLKDQIRHRNVETLAPGILSSWDLPYQALFGGISMQADKPSPFGMAAVTPDNLNIQSPETTSPGGQTNAPSPTMQLVRQKMLQDRSNLLMQGRFEELLISCGREDRIILTSYLHEFYIHTFVTAKFWGRGPRQWSAEMVAAMTNEILGSPSPSVNAGNYSPDSRVIRSSHDLATERSPTQLCQWAIHVREETYEGLPEPQYEAVDGFDVQDPSSWNRWTDEQLSTSSLPGIMEKGLSDSSFTTLNQEALPISSELIMHSVQQNPAALQVDAWKFAIMAGNSILLIQMHGNYDGAPDGIENIYPFHLAAAFLDGGTACCGIFNTLLASLSAKMVHNLYIDSMGHTVLDALMISILRSHTTVTADRVSEGFKPTNRYPGEEKDMCGRWDIDSPLVCNVLIAGHARIPTAWKHAFCHTSAQAVCHAAILMFSHPKRPDINLKSGLFKRYCANCGLLLQLGPLHVLVVVAFHVGREGMAAESLFGILAVLVCLLSLGADASFQAAVSIEDILGTADSETCHHQSLNAYKFMESMSVHSTIGWRSSCRVGWHCMSLILRQALEVESERVDSAESDDDDSHTFGADNWAHDFHHEMDLPCGGRKLGIVWAAVQTELLTYRRLEDSEPWVSANFSMEALQEFLSDESPTLQMPLVENNMMRPFATCGWFINESLENPLDFLVATAEQVSICHFMNMDAYRRTSFISSPDLSYHY